MLLGEKADMFEDCVREYVSNSFKYYNEYAFSAGYMEGMLKVMFKDLPASRQQYYLDWMKKSAAGMAERVAEKQTV